MSAELWTTDRLLVVHTDFALILGQTLCAVDWGTFGVRDNLALKTNYFGVDIVKLWAESGKIKQPNISTENSFVAFIMKAIRNSKVKK